MQQIRDRVFVETRIQGSNPGFVVTDECLVMIDSPQQPSDAMKWRKAIEGKGEIRYLINTEPHGDHVIGNFFFPGAVISHEKTKEALSSLSVEMIVDKIKDIDPEGLPLMEGYFLKTPSITFSEDLSLHLGKHTFELIHLPGHTAGQTAVYIPEERLVFTGDNIFHKVQSYLHQAYPEEWLKSLKRIEELDVDVIVPGHGELCDKKYLKEQASFIREWVEAVSDAIKQGLSKEEAKAKISFLDRYPMDIGLAWRGPQVQGMNVERLYDLLKQPSR